MGQCCGKEAKSHPFSNPGHTLGGAQGSQAQNEGAPIPSKPVKAPTVGGPGRKLGQAGTGEDPRIAAARAAEDRAAKAAGSGGLADKLAAQRKAGMKGALQQSADENRRAREADAATDARNWN